MAVLDVNFYSNVLMRPVIYKAIIPIDGPVFPGTEAKKTKELETVYLLHGIMGNCNDWTLYTRVVKLAEQYNVAVIMPSGENSFYVDQETQWNHYGEYIGKELVEETRKLFPLSHKKEDTFIAGLSMGGYGAIRNGLKYNDTFGAIAALSAALVTDQALEADEKAEWFFSKKSYYETIFGDLSKLKGSDKDPEWLVKNIKAQNGSMPRMYLACGTEDDLLVVNRRYRDFLKAENVKHTYAESSGIHDWKFWDEYIEKALKWVSNIG
ncbi:alpha/beta hydrolase [Clostridium oryzae]|uniref:Enterobactin/ferric enterobactin esterase n=1 Tax=Clostridium oryzae TaxID=1450648 RepID=A0A1V4IPI1_9CLOT|nr:alpha/beta hydrolase family protein [Clostridium oryzae]OPJ61961.1 enterobactin/ferric enterobactin esterase [Clostridium oryzae]